MSRRTNHRTILFITRRTVLVSVVGIFAVALVWFFVGLTLGWAMWR